MKKRVVIIGAGYGGIALANLLGKAGYLVDVIEKNETLGGRVTSFSQQGFTFDIGPSWYLMPEVFEQYYQLFGASSHERLQLVPLKPGYKVFFENQSPVVIQGNLEKDLETFESIESGSANKLQRYVSLSSHIYTVATKHFLYTNFQRLHELLKPVILKSAPRMLGMVFRPLDSYVASIFKDARLKKILEYHMVFLGSSPFQAPAIYSLMSHLDFKSGVFYPGKGMQSLITDLMGLGASYDITYHTNKSVVKVTTDKDTATGVLLDDGQALAADIVVSNADLHFTETQLLEKTQQTYPEKHWKKRQPGPSALMITMGVRGTLPDLLHHSLLFVDDWRGNFDAIYKTMTVPQSASIYLCNPSKTDPNLAPSDTENLFALIPLPAGIDISAAEELALADRFIEQIGRMIDAPDLAERIIFRKVFGPNNFKSSFNAWNNNAFGGESHLLNQSVIFRTKNISKKIKNLYYVGAGTLPGIGLPMCLMSAQLAYKRIHGIKTGGPLQSIPTEKP